MSNGCSVAELARAVRVSEGTIRRYARSGVVSAQKMSGRWVIDLDSSFPNFRPAGRRREFIAEVTAWIARRRVTRRR